MANAVPPTQTGPVTGRGPHKRKLVEWLLYVALLVGGICLIVFGALRIVKRTQNLRSVQGTVNREQFLEWRVPGNDQLFTQNMYWAWVGPSPRVWYLAETPGTVEAVQDNPPVDGGGIAMLVFGSLFLVLSVATIGFAIRDHIRLQSRFVRNAYPTPQKTG